MSIYVTFAIFGLHSPEQNSLTAQARHSTAQQRVKKEMSKRKRTGGGSKSWSKLVSAHDTASAAKLASQISQDFSTPVVYTFKSKNTIFVFILPQSSNDQHGQSITFEFPGNSSSDHNPCMDVDLMSLRHMLLTQYNMQTPRLAYQGFPLSPGLQILKCNSGDTLICYDVLDNDNDNDNDSVEANKTTKTTDVIDLDAQPDVIDLLSDSDDEKADSTRVEEVNPDSNPISHNDNDNHNVNVNANDLKCLLSMGFPAKAARQALQAENGNVAAATQRLLDGGGTNTIPSSCSTSSSSSSPTSTSSSFKRKRQRQNAEPSIFDGHHGIRIARNYIATANEFDESTAYEHLPRHGVMLEQVSMQPLVYFRALLRPRDDDGNDDNGIGNDDVAFGQKKVITCTLRADQVASLASLEEEFQDSNISIREIRELFVVFDYNVESTRAALLN